MQHYVGIDVSLERSKRVRCRRDEAHRPRGPGGERTRGADLLVRRVGFPLTRIGLEAGPLSQCLHAALTKAGLAVELLETRHVRDALRAMPVKTDRKDARGIPS
jgi:transposase